MNDNGAHQDQPERQPTLMDDLTNLIPQANADFEDNLEMELLARLRTQNQKIEEKDMQNTIRLVKPLRRPIPLTLTATLLVAILGVATLFALNTAPQGDLPSGVALQPTTSETLDPALTEATQRAIDATASALSPDASGTPTPSIIGTIDAVENVPIRRGPDVSFSAFATLTPGAEVTVLGQNEDGLWYEVQINSGERGWVPSALVRLQTDATATMDLALEATRIIAEATTRALDATIAVELTSVYQTATRMSNEATQRAIDAPESTISPNRLTATHIVADATRSALDATLAFIAPTPVIADLQPIVIASRPIQVGQVIREENVSIAYVNATFSTREVYTEINDNVLGRFATVRIDPYTPLTTANTITITEAFRLPQGMAVVSIPINQITANLDGLEADDIVHLLYPGESGNSTVLTTEATVVSIVDSVITVFVSQADAELIYAVIDYRLLITIARTGGLPPGDVGVAVPLDDLTLLSAEPVEVGQRVDMLAALLFLGNTDDEFQTLFEQAPEQLETNANRGVWSLGDYPQISENDDADTPQLIIQQILDDVMVTAVMEENGETLVMFAVNSQDAVVLQYLVEARVPLAIVR